MERIDSIADKMQDYLGAARTTQGANLIGDPRDSEEDLICEALVKEIGRGGRWCAMVEAWQALLMVRRMGRDMRAERDHLRGAGAAGEALSRNRA